MKTVFAILGFISLGLAILGLYLPLIPATPFLLLSTASFAKSSDRFNKWFKNTKLYQENILPILKKKGMTMQRKYRILSSISLVFILSIILVPHTFARILLAALLLGHWAYFILGIKTIKEHEDNDQ